MGLSDLTGKSPIVPPESVLRKKIFCGVISCIVCSLSVGCVMYVLHVRLVRRRRRNLFQTVSSARTLSSGRPTGRFFVPSVNKPHKIQHKGWLSFACLFCARKRLWNSMEFGT